MTTTKTVFDTKNYCILKHYKQLLAAIFFLPVAAMAQSDSLGKALHPDTPDDFSGLEMLEAHDLNHRIYISGKVVGFTAYNAAMEMKLFRYLHKKCGVRTLAMQTSPAMADLINDFIRSNDTVTENMLKAVSSKPYMKLYRSLKQLGQADSNIVTVIGTDVEKFSALPILKIQSLLPTENIPENLQIPVEALDGISKYIKSKGFLNLDANYSGYSYLWNNNSGISARKSVMYFLHTYDSLNGQFKSWLGGRYDSVNQSVQKLRTALEWEKKANSAFQFAYREETIINTLKQYLVSHPHAKIYGEYELCRVTYGNLEKTCDFYNLPLLVNQLKSDPDTSLHDILNIGFFYKSLLSDDSEYESDGEETGYNTVHDILSTTLLAAFDSVGTGNVRMFRIQGQTKPDSLMKLHFSYAILNNHFPLSKLESDTSFSDTLSAESSNEDSEYNYGRYEWYEKWDWARLYLGANYTRSLVNFNKINDVLKTNGLAAIPAFGSYGAEFAVASADQSYIRFSYNQFNYKNYYSMYQMNFQAGYNFIYRKHVKTALSGTMGFSRQKLMIPGTNNSSTFFTSFDKPKLFTNPATTMGVALSAYYDFTPFYVFANGGYQWDISNTRWIYQGDFTGDYGRLSNTSFYFSVGLGFSIPQ